MVDSSTPAHPASNDSERTRRLARSTFIVMMAFGLAKVISLGQTVLIAGRFGIGAEWDAYVAANKIPDLLFILISGGALTHAFIPIFSSYLARDDTDGAWETASHVINTIFMVTAIASIVVFFAAPWLVSHVVAPGFDKTTHHQTVQLMRILLIGTLIFSVSGIVMGILHSFNHFLLPAIAPIMLDLGILFGVLFLMPIDALGVYGVALGAILGASLHLGIQIPGLIHFRMRWKPALGFNNPALWRIIRLMLPRIAGLGVFHINFIVMNNIASRLGTGSVSALDWGWKLMQIPQTLIGTAMGIVIFPTLAALSERGDETGKRDAMSGALRFILVASIPAAVGLIMLGRPIVSLLERGAFDASASDLVYGTLRFFSLGLIVHAALEVVARSFYADKDTLTPLWAALGGATINLVLSFTLSGVNRAEAFTMSNLAVSHFAQFGFTGQVGHVGGLALANSCGVMFEVGLLLILLRRRWHGINGDMLSRAVVKTTAASLIMAAGIVILDSLWYGLGLAGGGLLFTVAHVGLLAVSGAGIFFLAAWWMNTEELIVLVRIVLRREKKHIEAVG